MAGRAIAASYYLALIFHLVLLTECNYGVRYGDRARKLHIAGDGDSPYRKPLIVDRRDADPRRPDGHETSFNGRTRRDAPSEYPNNNPNITAKVRCIRVYVYICTHEGRRRCVAIQRPAAIRTGFFFPPYGFSNINRLGRGKSKKKVDIRDK